MQTIIMLLNPGKLQNPDLDLRYLVPDRIEEVSASLVKDNGYDYIDAEAGQPGPLLGIWLETENAAQNWPLIAELFQNEQSASAQIYMSDKDTDDLENCTLVFPQ